MCPRLAQPHSASIAPSNSEACFLQSLLLSSVRLLTLPATITLGQSWPLALATFIYHTPRLPGLRPSVARAPEPMLALFIIFYACTFCSLYVLAFQVSRLSSHSHSSTAAEPSLQPSPPLSLSFQGCLLTTIPPVLSPRLS